MMMDISCSSSTSVHHDLTTEDLKLLLMARDETIMRLHSDHQKMVENYTQKIRIRDRHFTSLQQTKQKLSIDLHRTDLTLRKTELEFAHFKEAMEQTCKNYIHEIQSLRKRLENREILVSYLISHCQKSADRVLKMAPAALPGSQPSDSLSADPLINADTSHSSQPGLQRMMSSASVASLQSSNKKNVSRKAMAQGVVRNLTHAIERLEARIKDSELAQIEELKKNLQLFQTRHEELLCSNKLLKEMYDIAERDIFRYKETVKSLQNILARNEESRVYLANRSQQVINKFRSSSERQKMNPEELEQARAEVLLKLDELEQRCDKLTEQNIRLKQEGLNMSKDVFQKMKKLQKKHQEELDRLRA